MTRISDTHTRDQLLNERRHHYIFGSTEALIDALARLAPDDPRTVAGVEQKAVIMTAVNRLRRLSR